LTPRRRREARLRSGVKFEASAAAGWQVDDARELVPRGRWLGALRLVLGGHSRAPQRYGPRLCAKHQSLRPGIATAQWDYPPAFPRSHRAAAGPRRTQPRSGVRLHPRFHRGHPTGIRPSGIDLRPGLTRAVCFPTVSNSLNGAVQARHPDFFQRSTERFECECNG
jgi:hypothetical protein